MANLRFVFENVLEAGQLVVAAQSQYPASNLYSHAPGREWRAPNLLPISVLMSWSGAQQVIDHVSMWRHNLVGSRFSIAGFSDAQWTTQTYSLTDQSAADLVAWEPTIVAPGWRLGFDPACMRRDANGNYDRAAPDAGTVRWLGSQTVRSLSVTLYDGVAVVGNAWRIGKMFVGKSIEVPEQPDFPMDVLVREGPTGKRELRFSMNNIPEDFRPTLLDAVERVGTDRMFVVSSFPLLAATVSTRYERDFNMLVKMVAAPTFSYSIPLRHRSAFVFREV